MTVHAEGRASSPRDELPYPPAPPRDADGVVAALVKPTRVYKRNAALACLGLGGFVLVYLALTAYFVSVVWRLLGRAIVAGDAVVIPALMSLPAIFFLAFLVRGLFVMRRGSTAGLVELREADEPQLFAFIRRLADETSAPRPHRIFLSPRVNAAVFYDLSFFNLIIPTRKNLEIGLGLVNALTLDELKAVIAHELGHFAQRTMAVGRWVYVAEQIAGHVVASRGMFDRFLGWISAIDLRIAWIGWLMRVFVWAIRAVLDTVFRIVVIADRALSREMEFQADRVAVSVSGSDSLIHALHKIGAADQAWETSISFIAQERDSGRIATDLFAVQATVLDHLRRIRGEPGFGRTPIRPLERAADHRVFVEELAQPPAMWSTHPPNREREDHAKRFYLPSALDERSAWILFADPDATRRSVTEQLTQLVFENAPNRGEPPKPVPEDVTFAHLEERMTAPSLDPRYRGVYLERSPAAYAATSAAMIADDARSSDRDALLARIAQCYPETLREEMAHFREQRLEEAMLKGLEAGILTAPGGVIKHRGKVTQRKHLAQVIASARAEREATEARLYAHDRTCRAVHLDAARLRGEDWHAYLLSLVQLLHYATHTARNVADATGHLMHLLDVVLADGRVSSEERERVLAAAHDLQGTLERVWFEHGQLRLPPAVKLRFDATGGFEALSQRLGTTDPSPENLGDWLVAAQGWARGAALDFQALSTTTLDTLLEAEQTVAKQLESGAEPSEAPETARVPATYETCVVGRERERSSKLDWWDRFQLADGVVPGTARFVVACGLLAPALFLGSSAVPDSATIRVHNGLDRRVDVSIGGEWRNVGEHQNVSFSVDHLGPVHIVAKTFEGEVIEELDVDVDRAFGDYVYNVAQAAVLVRWYAVYGTDSPRPEEFLGTTQFTHVSESYVLDEPPESMQTRGSGATYGVISAVSQVPADGLLSIAREEERLALVRAHLRWDASDSAALDGWIGVLTTYPQAVDALLARADRGPRSTALEAALLGLLDGDARLARCELARREAEAQPDDVDDTYLAVVCMSDGAARYEAYLRGHAEHPTHGRFAMGAAIAYETRRDYVAALEARATALRDPELAGQANTIELCAVRAHRVGLAANVPDIGSHMPVVAAPEHSPLAMIALIEDPSRPSDDTIQAYRYIESGQLADAVTTVEQDEVPAWLVDEIRALAAASVGADPEMVARGRDLVVRRPALGPGALAGLCGVAAREGWEANEVCDQVGVQLDIDVEGEASFREVMLAATRDDTAALQALADRLPYAQRGYVLLAGLVKLGDAAPPAWRTEVRALLFPSERPFIGPPS